MHLPYAALDPAQVVDSSLLGSYKRIEWTLIFTLLTQVSMVGTLCYRHRAVMRDILRADRAYMKVNEGDAPLSPRSTPPISPRNPPPHHPRYRGTT